MSESDKVVSIRPAISTVPVEPVAPTLEAVITQMEVMASNIAILIEFATRMDMRIRALELSMRKMERRNVPAIVNQDGRPVTSKASKENR